MCRTAASVLFESAFLLRSEALAFEPSERRRRGTIAVELRGYKLLCLLRKTSAMASAPGVSTPIVVRPFMSTKTLFAGIPLVRARRHLRGSPARLEVRLDKVDRLHERVVCGLARVLVLRVAADRKAVTDALVVCPSKLKK